MKTTKRAVVAGLVVSVALLVGATPALLTGGFTTVNNTTNDSAAIAVGSFGYPRGGFVFGNNGLSNTNALANLVQLSLDSSNWVTIGIYRPSGTNATNEGFMLPVSSQTVFLRVRTVTTNSVQMTVLYQQ